jgi:hypothetical protein
MVAEPVTTVLVPKLGSLDSEDILHPLLHVASQLLALILILSRNKPIFQRDSIMDTPCGIITTDNY